jgi:hypothetical protein
MLFVNYHNIRRTIISYLYIVGHVVAQFFQALRYKSEGRGFIDIIHPARTMALGSTQPIKNEYQEYFLGDKGGRCLGLTTLPPSCADCLEICEPQPPGTLRACPGL